MTTNTADLPVASMSFTEVCAGAVVWRRWLIRRWRGFIPDLDAEISASIWEQYRSGCVDQDRLFAAARVAIRRVARREQRLVDHVRVDPGVVNAGIDTRHVDDPLEDLIRRTDAATAVAGLTIPARAREWVEVVTVGGTASRRSMLAGRRWANRVRDELVGVHGAA